MADGIDGTIGRKAWITSEIRARRRAAASRYERADVEALHETGRISIRPMGTQVLLRAVLVGDCSEMGTDDYDARSCVAHEVIALGGAVEARLDQDGVPDDARDDRTFVERLRARLSSRGARIGARPRPGDHVFVVTAAADRLSKEDKSVRLWLADLSEIEAAW